ncbi:MAG: hypothetical protein OEM21_04810 [Nitrosopumilus sp.]|nr:hypothetical protein [Nitrosopumilus sp.]
MKIKSTNLLIFGLLVEGVAHVMIFQNGYWNDFIWMITIPSLVILFTVYQHMKNNEIKKKTRRIKRYSNF